MLKRPWFDEVFTMDEELQWVYNALVQNRIITFLTYTITRTEYSSHWEDTEFNYTLKQSTLTVVPCKINLDKNPG